MTIRKYIPNTITCLSLACGCVAAVLALRGNLEGALWAVVLSACFDFMDGLAARTLHAYSPIGKELDSLADEVAFGLAPGMMLFRLIEEMKPGLTPHALGSLLPYLAFFIPVFSALRLAKFNIDARQSTSFLGLPVPAHALLWASLVCTLQPLVASYGSWPFALALVVLAFLSSLLLVSECPMFSFKVKSIAWKGNELRYITLAAAVFFIALGGLSGIAATILLYLLLSLLFYKRKKEEKKC
ncbi:MAG: CDP-diacylglycerol--serine O-phosphatidyltransferase [Tannerella sp.]|jgi:CDP-diacylglycerol--serine O-phosphatidyltransferase|nr:CDP-diacylglycerol--serine O-phosphatidyltransferase [Tannerella sp.]